ncbi:phosphatidylglycerophosphatase A family protein [Aidingimonas halophila]|uniref:Phosphatidylglycerophosphatase A n=1 Tax=Aidingimonas halophila TaxID=574349 RepID=A0A1H3EWH3_9GAMM|nr:phosphatidylglycerophosphatase A [Aidingimonas halophila]GHC31869.1 phosphatidylglycerophosphatase A [Aidingimonas halophila]SDX83111.1 phosphatidylglycerophosphatase A [Aidingimonas halophila]
MTDFITALATGFGLGQSPILPGTVGALPGLLLAWWVLRHSRRLHYLIAGSLLVIAVPICHIASDTLGGKDDSRIVADEFMAFPAAVAGQLATRHPAVMGGTFALSRIADGIKPPPAAQLEHVAGGLGIVLDDLVANLYVWLIIAVGLALWRRGKPSTTQ